MELHETTKHLHSKGNRHQTEATAHRIGEKSLPAIYLTNTQNLQAAQTTKFPKNQ
jgi:hypothetical protein